MKFNDADWAKVGDPNPVSREEDFPHDFKAKQGAWQSAPLDFITNGPDFRMLFCFFRK